MKNENMTTLDKIKNTVHNVRHANENAAKLENAEKRIKTLTTACGIATVLIPITSFITRKIAVYQLTSSCDTIDSLENKVDDLENKINSFEEVGYDD